MLVKGIYSMDNKKVFFSILLGFFFLSLLAVGYFSYMLWFKPNQKVNVTITPKINLPGDSIVKDLISNNGGFIFYINGTFPHGLEAYGTGTLLRGEFFIKGYSSSQGIPVYIGAKDGYSTLGIYDGSFQNSVTWSRVLTSALPEVIKPNDPINLKITYHLTGNETDNYLNDVQNVFTNISNAMKNGSKYEVPLGFNLATESLGILK
jgi:hypothetical protein